MMNTALLVVRVLLATVLALDEVAKLVAHENSRRAVVNLGVPLALAVPLGPSVLALPPLGPKGTPAQLMGAHVLSPRWKACHQNHAPEVAAAADVTKCTVGVERSSWRPACS
jgi:hypothetical protein